MNRKALIVVMLLSVFTGYGQERFFRFVDGWVSNYSLELSDKYLTVGLTLEGGSSQHNHIYYELGLDGSPIDSTYFGIDSLYTTTLYPFSSSPAVPTSQGLIIAAYGGNVSDNTSTGFLFNYDLETPPTLEYSFSEAAFTTLNSIYFKDDSTYLVSGTDSDSGIKRALLYDYNPLGEIRWMYSSTCGILCTSRIVDIIVLSDGGIGLLISEYDDNFPNQEERLRTALVKLNSLGEEQWRRHPGNWEGFHINPGGMVEIDGEILVSHSDPYFYNEDDEWEFSDSCSIHISRYDLDGQFISEHDYMLEMTNNLESPRVEYDLNMMQLLEDGEILLSGSTGPGGLLMKIQSDGSLIWFREILWHPLETQGGFSQQGFFRHVIPTSDGGFLATGDLDHSPSVDYPFDFYRAIAVKLDEYGCLEPGCQTIGVPEYHTSKSLAVYPNPAQNIITIAGDFNIKELNIEIIDCSGSIVLRPKTNSDFKVDISSLDSGFYLVRVSDSQSFFFGRLIVNN